MKIYPIFLLFILFFISFGKKKYRFIRYLDDNFDISDNIETDDEESNDDLNEEDLETDSNTDYETEIYDNGTKLDNDSVNPVISDLIINDIYSRSIIILIGFGYFQVNLNTIIFKTYFRKVDGNSVLSKNMNTKVKIEKNEFDVNCSRITNDNEENIQYNCSFPISEENKSLKNISFLGNFHFIGMEDNITKPQVYLSSYANQTINNLENALGVGLDSGLAIFNPIALRINDFNFNLSGIMEETIKDDKITLFFDEKGNGNIKSLICNIEKSGTIYNFECKTNETINAPLNGVIGEINNINKRKVLIYTSDENYSIINTDIIKNYSRNYEDNNNITEIIKVYSNISKYILVGFDSYKSVSDNYILFKAYLTKIQGNIYPEILYLNLDINNSKRLRILEQKPAQCERITEININEMQYNCSVSVNSNRNITISVKEISFKNNYIINFSPNAINTMNKIEKQTGEYLENLVTLNNSELTINNTKFIIEGNINSNKNFNEKWVILPLENTVEGKIENFNCTFNSQGNIKYRLECPLTKNINANLSNALGYASDKPILIVMKNENNSFINFENNITDEMIGSSTSKKEKSSSKIPGGAIAGIIIGVVAIIVATIIIILCCKSKSGKSEPQNLNTQSNSNIDASSTSNRPNYL